MPRVDYSQTPFLIIWETTQACDLACRHCRASAQPDRHPLELTTEEGVNLLRQAADLGTPIFILSGGDPLKRADLYTLIRTGADLGMRMATIPAATDLLTEDVVVRLKDAGLSQMALSLDFPRADLHDAFRGVPGAYSRTMQAVAWAHRHRLPLQINTTLCGESLPYLEEMAGLVRRLGVVFWEVFFLVPMGRGASLRGLSAPECEATFAILYRVQKNARFLVKITEAPHFRRYVTQREWEESGRAAHDRRPVRALPSQLLRTEGPGHTIGLASRGVNAGNGFLFISHSGEVYPSGFLPLSAGNVRGHSLAWIYRQSALFRQLRRPDELKGICGLCEFNGICGGSRSRAFALTGDYLASDPWCVYRPQQREAAGTAPPTA
ncbi:MAG: TIGR04053 family radical SAM/SPASM domain-containing protein [Acidobacteria bacterium]|nr:TIGR04053 family radical SAM/SPASM domain-containing protein [Acidobacteriota bacterium]